ncbi:MAG TPA: hypothetical protein VF832_09940 [Longimicrobiales bacterium]
MRRASAVIILACLAAARGAAGQGAAAAAQTGTTGAADLFAPALSRARTPDAAEESPPSARVSITPAFLWSSRLRLLRLQAEVTPVEFLRGWARAGLFHVGGTCPNDAASCDRNGQEVSAGLDLMAPTGTPLTPYLGAGAAYRVGAADARLLEPVAHVGMEFTVSRWIRPRLELEWTRYPILGSIAQLTAGIRFSLPGV